MKKDLSVPMADKTNYLTEDQVNRILSVAKKEKEWLLIYLLWRTGRRISELLKLKPQDIDFDNNSILWKILKKGKDKKNYTTWIAVDEQTIKTLLQWIANHNMEEDDYFFISNKSNKDGELTHLTRKWAFEVVRKLTQRARVIYKNNNDLPDRISKNGKVFSSFKGWHPHHFRHSYSINFLRKVKDPSGLSMLKQQLDHSSTKVTEHYLQFSQEERVKVLNKIYGNQEDDKRD